MASSTPLSHGELSLTPTPRTSMDRQVTPPVPSFQSHVPMKGPASASFAFDWPMSREEKKKRALSLNEAIYNSEIQEANEKMKSDPAVVESIAREVRLKAKGSRPAEEEEGENHNLLMTPTRVVEHNDGDTPTTSSTRASAGLDSVARSLHRFSAGSDSNSSSSDCCQAPVDPALIDDVIIALSKLRAATVVAEQRANTGDVPSEDDELLRTLQRSRSEPDRKFRTTSKSALRKNRKGRRSMGPDDPDAPLRVRFSVDSCKGSDSDGASDREMAKFAARGRSPRARRVSRGPDGRPYRIKAKKEAEADAAAATRMATAATTAATAVAGGVGGSVGGGVLGAAIGVPAAFFTFGLSIPIGAAIGGGAGLWSGAAVGGTWGYRRSTAEPQATHQTDDSD